jgi:DNA-binding NarL/FixJ family response regulator
MKRYRFYQIADEYVNLLELDKEITLVTFSSIEESIEFIRMKKPDLIILYLNKESETYYELQAMLQELELKIPIIVLSKQFQKEEALRLIIAGASDFIDLKEENAPILLQESVLEIMDYLEQKKLLKLTSKSSTKNLKKLIYFGLFSTISILFALYFIR